MLGVDPETVNTFKRGVKQGISNTPFQALATGPTTGDIQPKVEEAIGAPLYEPHRPLDA